MLTMKLFIYTVVIFLFLYLSLDFYQMRNPGREE